MLDEPGSEFVAFDLEATGLSPAVDRIVEAGAVRFDAAGKVRATFERLVNPLQPSAPMAQSMHRISDESLADAETAEVVLPAFVAFLGDPATTTLLAHNAAFDAGLLGHELVRAGLPIPGHFVVDTLAWSRRRWPNHGSHKLDALARRLGFEEPTTHRALADSHRVRAVFLHLRAESDGAGDDHPPLAYPIFDGAGPPPVPRGWERVAEAIAHDGVVQIEYLGGTRGATPRAISPQAFAHRGGVAYLVAVCHLDGKVKEFQVDRIRNCQVVGPAG